jgi:hypothetical protein
VAAIGRLSHLVVDCTDADRLGLFWSEALGVEVAARWHQYVMLTPTIDGGPVAFQEVPGARGEEPRTSISRCPTSTRRRPGSRPRGSGDRDHEQDGVNPSSPTPRATSCASC